MRTLQSLDSDSNASNGITINPTYTETFKHQSKIDLDDSSTTDDGVNEMIGDYKVDADEAKEHFEQHKDEPSNGPSGYTPPSDTTATDGDIGNSGKYTLVAWNDLGMHCVDGKDYSVFSILPPYNNLHAHLISKDNTTGKSITANVTLTYEAVADSTGSINTTSKTKTNFWDWVLALFGSSPSVDHGLNLTDPSVSNATPSLTPKAMKYNSTNGWWEAEGIPVMPYDDNGKKNYYPMVKVVAKDSTGSVLATTKVVLPVSDEMSCVKCHATNSVAAAKPSGGWVNDTIVEKDWKRNILRLHDENHPNAISKGHMETTFTKGSTLLANADAGQPVLCASCHKSNALGTSLKTGIPPLTQALHSIHADVIDPDTGKSMNSSTNRDSCYKCHPGSATKCLRGTMGNAKTATGANAIDCQSCHGSMSTVGQAGREGWLDQPNCQNCHDKDFSGKFQRYTSVFSSGTTLRTTIDTRFATNSNTPMSGKSLYRFSKGHGNLQCEACHGSTHAEYPSSHINDNVQSVQLQGHSGTIAECSTCHTNVPSGTANFTNGPHGMHVVGQTAIHAHKKVAEYDSTSCTACHGADYRGSFLSKTWTARTFSVEGSTKTFKAGQIVSCYDCHGKKW